MAYDEGLAQRIEEHLRGVRGVTSKELFGGVCFLVDDKMFVGVVKDELMVRVGKGRHAELVKKPGARTMDFTKRPMIGYIFVTDVGVRSDADLATWIDDGLAFTKTVVAKPKKPSLTRAAAKKAPAPGR